MDTSLQPCVVVCALLITCITAGAQGEARVQLQWLWCAGGGHGAKHNKGSSLTTHTPQLLPQYTHQLSNPQAATPCNTAHQDVPNSATYRAWPCTCWFHMSPPTCSSKCIHNNPQLLTHERLHQCCHTYASLPALACTQLQGELEAATWDMATWANCLESMPHVVVARAPSEAYDGGERACNHIINHTTQVRTSVAEG